MSRTPSLHGVEVKLARARLHYQAFDAEWSRFQKLDLYRFRTDVYDGGRRHVIRAVDPPALPDHWTAIVGDFFHNLRSALDHLAWQLVLLNKGQPSEATQFPVKRRKQPNSFDQIAAAELVSGGVSEEAADIIKSVQREHSADSPEARFLWWIHTLNVIDKHRRILMHASAVYGVSGDVASVTFTKRPLRDQQVVVVVTFDPPRFEPEAQVAQHVKVVLGDGAPRECVGVPVESVMMTTYLHLEALLNRFRPLFHEQPVNMNEVLPALFGAHVPDPNGGFRPANRWLS